MSFYKALLEIDSKNALRNTNSILIDSCKTSSKVINKLLKLPGIRSFFMKILFKMAVKMFGRQCGFDYENFKSDKKNIKIDMTMCPYIKYAKKFNTPELIPTFCESDFALYGEMPGIEFKEQKLWGLAGKNVISSS